MLSTRQHLAFASRPSTLILGRLGRLSAPAGAIPCKSRTAFERRCKRRKKTCLTLEDFDEIDRSLRRNAIIETLQMYEVLEDVPEVLSKRDVLEMLLYKRNARPEYFKFLQRRESHRIANSYETYHYHRHFRQKIPNLGLIFDQSGQLLYGPYNNTLFTIVQTLKSRDMLRNLSRAALFGPRLVVDFSYDNLMRSKEQHSLAGQCIMAHAYNRAKKEPVDLWFANYSGNRYFEDRFKGASGGQTPDQLMITVKQEPLEQLFPIEQMIYMSPHSSDVMTEFDPDAIYVVGALIDTYRSDKEVTSFKRASRSNIKSLRLPVLVQERKNCPPCLTVSSVIAMLVDMRNEKISVTEALNRHLSLYKMRAPYVIYRAQQYKQKMQQSLQITN